MAMVLLLNRYEGKIFQSKSKTCVNVFTTTATTLSDGSKKGRSEFRWTDDELELLLKYYADFKSQKEYQGIIGKIQETSTKK